MKKMLLSLALALIISLTLSSGFALAEDMEGSAAKEPAAAEEPAAPVEPAPIKVHEVGDTLPYFALPDGLSGKTIEVSSNILGQDDRLIAMVFMTTSCSACQAEVALMSRLAAKHEKDLKVYVLAVDMRGDRQVKDYHQTYKYNVSYLLDPGFTVPPLFGFNYTPGMVLLDKKGEILYKKGGYSSTDADELIKQVRSRL